MKMICAWLYCKMFDEVVAIRVVVKWPCQSFRPASLLHGKQMQHMSVGERELEECDGGPVYRV